MNVRFVFVVTLSIASSTALPLGFSQGDDYLEFMYVVDKDKSIIHTSGGFSGNGIGDIRLTGRGIFLLRQEGDGLTPRNISVMTEYPNRLFFPEYRSTYDGTEFFGTQNVCGLLENYYRCNLPGGELHLTGDSLSCDDDDIHFHYDITANLFQPAEIPATNIYGNVILVVFLMLSGVIYLKKSLPPR
jgi:hypothetical protein